MFEIWQRRVRELKKDVITLYFACQDRRTPWYTKLLAALVVGYAFSPIDLIPDFIPVLGYLDDLILVPLGVLLVRRLIPSVVLEDCRRRAEESIQGGKPVIRIAAVAIIFVWILCAALAYHWLRLWLFIRE